MIGKLLAISLLSLSTAASIYKAGRYAAGGQDVIQGRGAAIAHGFAALIYTAIGLALCLDF